MSHEKEGNSCKLNMWVNLSKPARVSKNNV